MALKFTTAVFGLCTASAMAAPAADSVESLPMWGKPPAPQYSGYLDGSASEPGTMLHYWFSETTGTSSPDTPVILWLNGGPGSSSILGMLQELGPLLINQTGGLMENPYAWTKYGHLVVLESPAGVGYSYCASMKTGTGGCANTDKNTAATARAAMQYFFSKKFPELAKNPFFITGESYAGVYVPTLTQEILNNAPEINIKGIAVGDPCTDNKAQKDSMDMIWYGHKNGFLQDDAFNFLWNNCSARKTPFIAKGEWDSETLREVAQKPITNYKDTPECTLAIRQFQAGSSRGFSQGWQLAWINDLTLFGPAAVVGFDPAQKSLNGMTATYMNRMDVKKALNVADGPPATWPGPQKGWTYKSEYDACNGNVPPGADSMVDFYRRIAPRLEHGATVYNGDTDPCVSYEGTRNAIEQVGFKEMEGGHMRPWFFNLAAASVETLREKPVLFGPDLSLYGSGPQFGGHTTNYENGLSFVTIHGSGHMVPQFRPQSAERMLNSVLNKQMLSPLYPSNANMTAMSDDEFNSWLDKWTTAAKAQVA